MSVFLVGAGPGDPDLLTIKAARTIALADVILVDDLVNLAVLDHAKPDARIISVGKRGGCVSTPQDYIQRLMVSEHQKGAVVVRLKGGDPGVFGRAGEEIEYLRRFGIEATIINGITSGLAAASALGIALTHRDHSSGLVFVTGHHQNDTAAVIHWRALLEAKLTLVIYMGVSRLADLADQMARAGLAADSLVAVVHSVSNGNQKKLVVRFGDLLATVAASKMASPSVIIVGQVLQTCVDAINLNVYPLEPSKVYSSELKITTGASG